MQTKTVKDIMTPTSMYGTISRDASLNEAALALSDAQQGYEQDPNRHRLLLISDTNGKIVGKLSQCDIMRAFEPRQAPTEESISLTRFGISSEYLKSMFDVCGFWGKPLIDLCRESGNLKVNRLIETPSKGEKIEEDATLPQAIHRMAMEHHQSLLVTRDIEIVGVLRQTDLFKEVVKTLSVCEL